MKSEKRGVKFYPPKNMGLIPSTYISLNLKASLANQSKMEGEEMQLASLGNGGAVM